ncbi:thioesterase family [Aspergillus sclerotialis]|uniref:Thioesterase family n=1 Tax=Aspergillus sclerotialis TaxID=2070753 RepID=A0A3A2ZZG2_9EURO|nr:thioesterase family [Aspergillus sclerotialis]
MSRSLPFQPSDHVKRMEDLLQNNSLVRSLRANPSIYETRLYEEVPAAIRDILFTRRDFLGPGKITFDPLVFINKSLRSLTVIIHLGSDLSGWPGLIHGGMLATVMDEACGMCVRLRLPDQTPVTVQLAVKYQKPAPADEIYVLETKLVQAEGNTSWVEGSMRALGEDVGTQPLPRQAVVTVRSEYRHIRAMAQI